MTGENRRDQHQARQMQKKERRLNRKYLRVNYSLDRFEDDICLETTNKKPYINYQNNWIYGGYKNTYGTDNSKKKTHQQYYQQEEKIYADNV